MSKIIIELDKDDAERVLENYEEILDILKAILEEVRRNGKILRDD